MEKWQKDEVLTALDKATIDYAKETVSSFV